MKRYKCKHCEFESDYAEQIKRHIGNQHFDENIIEQRPSRRFMLWDTKTISLNGVLESVANA